MQDKQQCEKRHLAQDECEALIQSLHEQTTIMLKETQIDLHEDNFCDSEFLEILLNFAVRTSTNAMGYIIDKEGGTKEEIIDLVIGKIAETMACKFKRIDACQLTDYNSTAVH